MGATEGLGIEEYHKTSEAIVEQLLAISQYHKHPNKEVGTIIFDIANSLII